MIADYLMTTTMPRVTADHVPRHRHRRSAETGENACDEWILVGDLLLKKIHGEMREMVNERRDNSLGTWAIGERRRTCTDNQRTFR